MKRIWVVIAVCMFLSGFSVVEAESPWAKWTNGPPTDPNYFPLVANYQHPSTFTKYFDMGMNTFSGMDWPGVNASSMQMLKDHGAYLIGVIADDADYAYVNDKTVIGWGMCDEPDNWQYMTPVTIRGKVFPTAGGSFSGRIPTADYIEMYEWVKSIDPTRPIFLCLSQGVANDAWVGRGTAPAGGWPAEYTEYCKGTDVAGFDVYPVVSASLGEQYIWYQAKGLDNLKTWSNNKPVINAIETTHISNLNALPTPHQVRSEVWISIIHGAAAILYFLHEFVPAMDTAGIFNHQEIVDAVKEINTQITSLAPVINSTSVTGKATVVSSMGSACPIDIIVKEYNNTVYVFAASMRNSATTGVFHINGLSGKSIVNVLGESRTIEADNGTFTDNFAIWDVHLYAAFSSGSGGADFNPFSDIRVYPNPCKINGGTKKARFDLIMAQDVTIKLFNTEGKLVRTVKEEDYGNVGNVEWDLKNDSGAYISAGLYYYLAEDTSGHKKTGKIAVGK